MVPPVGQSIAIPDLQQGVLNFKFYSSTIICTFTIPMDGQNQNFLNKQLLEEVASAFPADNYIEEVDPVDFIVEDNTSSKPIAQSKSKFAFPFGAQISTPCTYGVF